MLENCIRKPFNAHMLINNSREKKEENKWCHIVLVQHEQ